MSRGQHRRTASHTRPYVLITTTNANVETAEHARRYPTMLAAANAFVHSTAPYKAIVHDDGHRTRELDRREEAMLVRVCQMLGKDVLDV
jgi:hypothetical protein